MSDGTAYTTVTLYINTDLKTYVCLSERIIQYLLAFERATSFGFSHRLQSPTQILTDIVCRVLTDKCKFLIIVITT